MIVSVKKDFKIWKFCYHGNVTLIFYSILLRVTRRARSPNVQVFVTHTSHVCSQHSFGLTLKMNGMHRTRFEHARFDLLTLVIRSRVF